MMDNGKVCPMLTTNTVIGENGKVSIGTQPVICLEEMCAWYISDKRKCAITVTGGKK